MVIDFWKSHMSSHIARVHQKSKGRALPCAAHEKDSNNALAISVTDASAIATGERKPALYSALAREP